MNALVKEWDRLWSLYLSMDQGDAADEVMRKMHALRDKMDQLERNRP